MKHSTWRRVLTISLVLFFAGFIALGLNWYRLAHIQFDGHRWQSDIYARRDLLNAAEVKPGMTEDHIRKLLGKPELEVGGKEGRTFTYLMPTYQISGVNKGVYYVRFEHGVVVDERYDDSGWDEYDKAEENSKELSSK